MFFSFCGQCETAKSVSVRRSHASDFTAAVLDVGHVIGYHTLFPSPSLIWPTAVCLVKWIDPTIMTNRNLPILHHGLVTVK